MMATENKLFIKTFRARLLRIQRFVNPSAVGSGYLSVVLHALLFLKAVSRAQV